MRYSMTFAESDFTALTDHLFQTGVSGAGRLSSMQPLVHGFGIKTSGERSHSGVAGGDHQRFPPSHGDRAAVFHAGDEERRRREDVFCFCSFSSRRHP